MPFTPFYDIFFILYGQCWVPAVGLEYRPSRFSRAWRPRHYIICMLSAGYHRGSIERGMVRVLLSIKKGLCVSARRRRTNNILLASNPHGTATAAVRACNKIKNWASPAFSTGKHTPGAKETTWV